MAQGTVEERLAELERQLADLKMRIDMLARPNDLRSVIGMFAGDEDLKRIFEAGRKIREEDRRRTMPKSSKNNRRTRS
ncbi:MAG TPA: hypothetical protein VH575_27105 [Gemmataceae bacterium]|jgi:hypothetical protein